MIFLTNILRMTFIAEETLKAPWQSQINFLLTPPRLTSSRTPICWQILKVRKLHRNSQEVTPPNNSNFNTLTINLSIVVDAYRSSPTEAFPRRHPDTLANHRINFDQEGDHTLCLATQL